MSLYLGDSANGANLLHVTNTGTPKIDMKSSAPIASTTFHSMQPYIKATYVNTIQGIRVNTNTTFGYYMYFSNGAVTNDELILVIRRNKSTGVYSFLGHNLPNSSYMLLQNVSNTYVKYTSNDPEGSQPAELLYYRLEEVTFPSGPISITNFQVNIGGRDLSTTTYLVNGALNAFDNKHTIFGIGDFQIMNTNPTKVGGLRLNNTEILATNLGGTTYPIIDVNSNITSNIESSSASGSTTNFVFPTPRTSRSIFYVKISIPHKGFIGSFICKKDTVTVRFPALQTTHGTVTAWIYYDAVSHSMISQYGSFSLEYKEIG